MARRTSSARDIEMEIRAQVQRDDQLDSANAELAEEVKTFIQSKTPVDTAEAVGSIRVQKVRKPRNGLPARTIYPANRKFHMIEYGTKADPEGTHSTYGPNTPTKAVAPFGQAKARFGDQL
ncbi:HK97 gp10 family phage protein [Mycolicibacterium fortuitum]|uniref:HK97 gp10 family phage protein n=1 Tax=Mycolicibacterium fortuitum TaxID=1766 RepID=UPI00096EB48B|nr:HK97 gp10 family phage protein [Mycolicibacterium fortuitum]OMC02173.1 hypothetical protein A5734_15015 [Mycolicibacterium fortuitum]